MKKKTFWNTMVQIALPTLTIAGFAITGLKHPERGLIANLIAQPFWLYSSWKAYKEAKQIGMFLTTLIICVVIISGLINYWFL